MVVARARSQMDRDGQVRRTARRQVSSRAPSDSIARSWHAHPSGQRAVSAGRVDRAEGQHGGPGTRDHGGYAVRAQAAYERERLRHRGLALLLVQPVAGGGEEVLGLAGERGHQQRRAAGVGGRVGVRDGRGQQAAGDLGLDARRRHEDDGGDPRVDADAHGVPVSSSRPEIDEAAVERGRHVVGVALEVGGEVEERLVGGEQLTAGDEAAGQHHSGDDRGRRRPEAAGVRDHVAARQAQSGRLLPHQLEGRPHGADDQVRLVARHAVRAGALDLDDQTVGQHLGLELVAQGERQPERVETGTEVGRRWPGR